MAYRAAIFDLYGTLVPSFSHSEHQQVMQAMAAALGAPTEAFAKHWLATFDQRCIGAFSSVEANILHVCAEFGVTPEPQMVETAGLIRFRLAQQRLSPIPGTLDALARIKRIGFKIGLISDCSIETSELWPACPLSQFFDVVIFSHEIGMKKPDPRIYLTACHRLGVDPADCIYVGDGGSRELSGALAVGMQPVLLQADADEADAFRVDGEQWDGLRVRELGELFSLFTLSH